MFTSPGAIALKTPFFSIYWYGIILAVAFLVGQFIVLTLAKKEYNDKSTIDHIYEIAFWALICGIVGARLYYVILGFDYYSAHLPEIIMVQNGGLSIHGGLIGGILGTIFYCKNKKIDFFKYADLYALGLPIAQSIGRWGNFFNSEAFGLPTNLPWGVYIPLNNRPIDLALYEYFHPTFLYESLWDIFIFVILFFILKKYFFKKQGVLFFSYLILYSIGRIFIECIRTDSVLNLFGIPVAIIVCFLTIIVSVVALRYVTNCKSE
ncbi:MAG: prolipoprotein diacylglyceryl transferase [Candidatus Gastranaerophilales bacterium]|nr:prolipoprotein diacylglyceryl transferase [Candidatus Gastranaerophilales bacterium]